MKHRILLKNLYLNMTYYLHDCYYHYNNDDDDDNNIDDNSQIMDYFLQMLYADSV